MIAVPYHLGRRDFDVGRGPSRILAALGESGQIVERGNSALGEWDAMIELNVGLAQAVGGRIGAPLILGGSCNLCLGALSGIRRESLGIVWFDAHGDFNTPASSPSGRLDGMALAVATGACHPELRVRIGLDRPVAGGKALLLEPRDLDPGEDERLESAGVRVLRLQELGDALNDLATVAEAAYVHVDLDVLDPNVSPGVNCTRPGGIAPDELYQAARLIGTRLPVAAAMIANYNPDRDPEDRTLRIAEHLAGVLCQSCGLS